MKTLLLSFTSCAIVGMSSVAAANPQSPFKQETAPIQQYASIDSDDTQSSGASNSPEAAPSQKPQAETPPAPAAPKTESQAESPPDVISQTQATAQSTTTAPKSAPGEPQTQSPAATQPLSPPTSSADATNGSIPKDQNSVQNQPIDPSYDEDPVTK